MSALPADAGALARLLESAYEVPVEAGNGVAALADDALATRLCVAVSAEPGLADWALVRLGNGQTLSRYQYGLLDTCERMFAALYASPAYHPALAEALMPYRGVFAAAALPADGWLLNATHPARRVLACIHRVACGWQPELGAAAASLRAQVESWLVRVGKREQTWQQTADIAERWLADERTRLQRLEQRLVDAEAGALRARRARTLAARTLNQALAHRPVGEDVVAILQNDWLAAMQWCLLSEGEQGPLWQRMKRITGTLRWTLSPEIGEENRNKLYRIVGQVTDDIEAVAPQVFHEDSVRDRVTGAFSAEHLRVLRNEPAPTAPFPPVDPHDALAAGDTALSSDLLARVAQLPVGQWLAWRDGEQVRRLRLLLREDDARQLLFVNALCAKALAIAFEPCALRLANGDAVPLPVEAPLAEAIARAFAHVHERHSVAELGRAEALRRAREQAAAEARARELARQKAMAEVAALEAARKEAQRKAEELERVAESSRREAEAVRQAAADAQRETDRQHLQRARLLASSLTIGAWVAFRDEDRVENRRLTVVLPSSGKYIFVDADGTGKREITRDELVRRLAEGSAAPLEKDQRLTDALSRVVDNLRNDRNKEDNPR